MTVIMNSLKHLCAATAAVLAFGAATIVALAQEPPASPAPEETSSPTFMDREYDGRTHIMVAPYIWGPTVKGNFEFSLPTLPRRPGGVFQRSFQVGPSDYVPKINSAAMFAFDARKGSFDVFGDYIYLNATTTSSIFGTIGGSGGRIQIPVTIDATARLRESIWEAAAGFTVARGHDADLSAFMGLREFPVNFIFGYDATVGKRGILAPSGSITTGAITQDVIAGLRGRAFFDDSHWYVPYYVDVGTGAGQVPNQTWEAFTGAGYAFNHGQTLIALWRALDYYDFSPVSPVQKLTLGGPLLGYTFDI
jgi:hypothetical protein